MINREAEAAIHTLNTLGYTYHGGDLWKPPIGKRPAWLDEAAPKNLDGELSLQRSNQEEKNISFRLRLGTGRTVTLTMSPYYFALMVTGMSDVPCEVSTRNVELRVAPRTPNEQALADHLAAVDKQRQIDEQS